VGALSISMLTGELLQRPSLIRRLLLLSVSLIYSFLLLKVTDNTFVGAFKGSVFVTRNARAYLERMN